jgi:hypothetical protein
MKKVIGIDALVFAAFIIQSFISPLDLKKYAPVSQNKEAIKNRLCKICFLPCQGASQTWRKKSAGSNERF